MTPPPPVARPPLPPPPPPARPPLIKTGAEVGGHLRTAGLLTLGGMMLVALASRRRARPVAAVAGSSGVARLVAHQPQRRTPAPSAEAWDEILVGPPTQMPVPTPRTTAISPPAPTAANPVTERRRARRRLTGLAAVMGLAALTGSPWPGGGRRRPGRRRLGGRRLGRPRLGGGRT